MILLSYYVSDHVYSKLKSIQLCTDLANIEVIRILALSYTDLYRYLLRLFINYEVKQILI